MFGAILFAHIVFAALVFGVPMGIGRNLRGSLDAGLPAFRLAAADAKRRGMMASGSGIGILLTGVGLILLKGGFGRVHHSYDIALTLAVAAILVGVLLLKPTMQKLVALGESDTLDTAAARALCKRVAMGIGINHLLWVVMLGLMIWPFLPPS